MDKDQPIVYIVILNYKNFSDTINCLESLRQSDYGKVRIIVVDNDSQNESLVSIAKALDEWGESYEMHEAPPSGPTSEAKHLLVQSGANNGYAAGNNVGIRIAMDAGADYVMILNNDTIVPADFPRTLVEFAEASPDLGVVGPKVIERDGRVGSSCARRRLRFLDNFFVFGYFGRLWRNNPWRQSYYYKDSYNYEAPKQVDMVSGSCMMIRTKVFEEVGLLDETTFLMCEEHILAERMRKTKFKTYIFPDSEIRHFHGQSRKLTSIKWMRQVSNESVFYYLTEYRGYSPCLARMALLLRWRPLSRPGGVGKRPLESQKTATKR